MSTAPRAASTGDEHFGDAAADALTAPLSRVAMDPM